MFFLLPPVIAALIVAFGLVGAWRILRARRPWALSRPGRRHGPPHPPLPLVPAALMRGADRTWVVFTTPGCRPCFELATRLRSAEPASQVTEVDAQREPRLAEAFRVDRLPAAVLANRYGQVETRLVGPEAVKAYTRAITEVSDAPTVQKRP